MTRSAAAWAKELKHRLWLGRRALWQMLDPALGPALDRTIRSVSPVLRPIRGVAAAQPGRGSETVPRRIFCLWTGDNPMTPARRRSMARLRETQGDVDVVLIEAGDVEDWVVPGHPLHPAYEDLALIHRSDYLRAYLLHHHGGGYTDVKEPAAGWAPVFDRMATSRDLWLIGYREASHRDVAPGPARVRRRLALHHRRLPGNGAYVVRAGTPMTSEWLAEVERRLDSLAGRLRASPGNVFGDNTGYPVAFFSLLGEVFHPLALRWNKHIGFDDRLRPVLTDYK